MAFLGSKSCHEKCSEHIFDYLEFDGNRRRAMAHDFCNIVGEADKRNWDVRMDKTRSFEGNDRDWGSKRAVFYRHFVISPDPKDKVELETLRELTTEWATYFFGNGFEPGVKGCYEVAIVYHDDNTNHVPHAHIIVNNTDLLSGRRLHFDNRDAQVDLPDKLQQISKKYGLRYFDNSVEGKANRKLNAQGRFITKAERAVEKAGLFSWKADLRARVRTAMMVTNTHKEFFEELDYLGVDAHLQTTYKLTSDEIKIGKKSVDSVEDLLGGTATLLGIEDGFAIARKNTPEAISSDEDLRALGFECEKTHEDWIYRMKNNSRAQSSGYRLGKNYTKAYYDTTRAAPNRSKTLLLNDKIVRENVNKFLDNARIVADVDESVALKEVAEALSVNRYFKIRSNNDYDKAISQNKRDLGRAMKKPDNEARVRQLKHNIKALEHTKEFASTCDLFVGIKPEPKTRYELAQESAKKKKTKRSSYSPYFGASPLGQTLDRSRTQSADGQGHTHDTHDRSHGKNL